MMMYDSLLARSFSKHEQKKLGYGALVACFFIALSFCTIFKPYLDPLQVLNLKLSIGAEEQKLQIVNETSSFVQTMKDEETIAKDSLVFNNISSSQEVVNGLVAEDLQSRNDTSSPSHIVVTEDAEAIMKDTQMVNQTSNTWKIAEAALKNPVTVNDTSSSQQMTKVLQKRNTVPICDLTGRSDFCDVRGDIRVDGNSGAIFIVTSEMDILAAENTSWNVRPYARKGDMTAMSLVREWSVKLVTDQENIPKCTQNHNVPSILFSLGGYSGNHFHAFTDIIIPLYATARPFNGDVQLLLTNRNPFWITKFGALLKSLSKYDLIDIDRKEDVHCFPGITVGLKGRSNKELSIDASTSPYSIKDFRNFLRSSYSLKRNSAIRIKNGEKTRPRLLIISRKRSRAFTNVGEISKMAKKLGFRVVTAEPDADVSKFAQIMNSCDVVLGVHGAGLTNIVFLPENAILIQIVPFGGAEWVSKTYFGEPSKGMNIKYLDYKIKIEESTLIQQYPADHVVLKDPREIGKQGWEAFKSIYLDKQNVNLDLNRFRPTLLKALELLHQ